MKNFKIIETGPDSPDVLLFRDDMNCIISAWGYEPGNDIETEIVESVVFEDSQSLKNFICDYSITSAEAFTSGACLTTKRQP